MTFSSRLALACTWLSLLACGGATAVDGERRSETTEAADVDASETGEQSGTSAATADANMDPVPEDPSDEGVVVNATGDPVPTDEPLPDMTGSIGMEDTVPMESTPSTDPDLVPGTQTPEGEPTDPTDNPAPDPQPLTTCTTLPPDTESEIARRLERLLWNTDGRELLSSLQDGELNLADGDAVAAQAELMLEDERSSAGLVAFAKAWLDLVSEDRYSSFEEPLYSSVLESTDRTLTTLIFGGDDLPADGVASLFTQNLAMVDTQLAAFYGVKAPTADWELTELPPAHALGLLTQAFWLNVNPNPPWRGAAVLRSLVCEPVPPAPSGFVPVRDITEEMGLTSRETFLIHQTDPACAGCHALMDPIGFAFEHFDGDGAYRADDGGLPIDASGGFSNYDLQFDGTEGLAELLRGELEPTVETCLVEQAVQYAVEGDELTRTYRVPHFEPGCARAADIVPQAGLDATLAEWIIAIARSDAFAAAYE